MEHYWCAVEAAAASMGEDFAQCLPLMRQAVAQVEWAVALDDISICRSSRSSCPCRSGAVRCTCPRQWYG
eukprot:5570692-Prymnesium_polylepis.1